MPVVTADGLGLRTRRGWVFRDVDLDVEPGQLVALTGPASSGRTSLLLALAGHFSTSTGTRSLTGRAALGLVPGINVPEAGLTVAEHVQERLILLGTPPDDRAHRAARVTAVLHDLPLPERALGRDLTPYQRHRLMLRLAEIGHPDLIAVDDVDTGLSATERAQLWDALTDLAERGHAVLVTCRELTGPAHEYSMEGHR